VFFAFCRLKTLREISKMLGLKAGKRYSKLSYWNESKLPSFNGTWKSSVGRSLRQSKVTNWSRYGSCFGIVLKNQIVILFSMDINGIDGLSGSVIMLLDSHM
jgi:hypothetical protein